VKTFYVLALAGFLIPAVAFADDIATTHKSAKAVVAAAKTDAAPVPAGDPQAQMPALISQQDKMRLCAKQATGKKGAERKAFMKTCLSKKA
jgi:hypothetical protein